MSDPGVGFPFSSRVTKTNKFDLKREIPIYDNPKSTADVRNLMIEKDMLIKSQRNTIKLYERKIDNLEKNNSILKQIIGILSSYITEDLNETLPPLPALPDESRKLAPISNQKKASFRGKSQSVDITSLMNSISNSSKVNSQSISTHNYIFDPSMQQNLFQDFHEAEFLKSIIDSQLSRDEMQKVMKFLLGKTSQDLFIYKTRTILFESLSLFLSLRNVAFLNSPEVFLPRTLEMLLDILEVEKITVFVYDVDSLCSVAVTAELPKAITVDKNFGHFAHLEDFLIINSACDDERFDKQYDQICTFVTKNLACVPMTTDQKTIGILECCNKRTDFIGEDLFLLGHVARQLAVAQIGIDIRDKLMSLHQSFKNPLIESSKESLLVPVLSTLASNLMEILSCEKVNVYLHLPASQELVNIASTGQVDPVRLPMNEGLAWLAFSSNSIINSDSSHKLFSPESDKRTGFATREVLAVPVKNLAVLECLNKKNFSKFSKSDEKKTAILSETCKTLFEAAGRLSGVLYTADINEFCLQNVKQAVFHINIQGVIQKLNPAACEFLGSKAEKVIGASFNETFDKFPQILKSFWTCVRSKTAKHEESVSTIKCDALVKFFLVNTLEESPSYLMIMSLI